LVTTPEDGETAVDDFTVVLFRILGYSHRPRLERTRVNLPLLICGESRYAETDVRIVDRSQNNIPLLVQEDQKLDEKQLDNARNKTAREMMGLALVEEKVSHLFVFAGPLYERLFLGHFRHRHVGHVACVFPDPNFPTSVHSYSSWDLSFRGNLRGLLLSARSSPWPPG
ncbi:hypothetical protein HYPSUDRAFT_135105, partial [Hypholoma sublateritium FD-334 SS-4]